MSGNGADLGAIYQAIIAISNELRSFKAEMGAFKVEMRAEFREVRAEIAELRQTVRDYHGSVIGHGVLITELDERVTRLEQSRS